MKKLTFTWLTLCLFTLANAQEKSPEMEVKTVIQSMFDGMRAGDSSMVARAFLRHASMQSVLYDQNGDMQLKAGNLDRFLKAIGTPHDEVWDEKIWSYDIRVDEPLATALRTKENWIVPVEAVFHHLYSRTCWIIRPYIGRAQLPCTVIQTHPVSLEGAAVNNIWIIRVWC